LATHGILTSTAEEAEMSLAISVIVLLVAFTICAWSGRLLAGHYQDRWEVAAVLAVGGCLFGAVSVTGRAHGATAGWPEAVIGLSMAAGLFAGYYRRRNAR
jgi:hypothetical protein